MIKTIDESEGGDFILIMSPKDGEKLDKKSPIPVEVKGLLEKYNDVMESDMPSNLPPLRDITHKIDLIP